MDKAQGGKGRDSALRVPLAAGLRPALSSCGSCDFWLGGAPPCGSFLLLQEFSKQRVIELVSAAT